MTKKKKKKGFLSQIKTLNQPKNTPFLPTQKPDNSPFLKELISQFRGGQDDFNLAMNQFLDLYESTLFSCQDALAYSPSQSHYQRDYYSPFISQFQANFHPFLTPYSSQEQATLVEAFMFSDTAQVAHLYRDSLSSGRPLKLTPSQVKRSHLYWLHYQIFSQYLLPPKEIHDTLFKNIDYCLFGSHSQNTKLNIKTRGFSTTKIRG